MAGDVELLRSRYTRAYRDSSGEIFQTAGRYRQWRGDSPSSLEGSAEYRAAGDGCLKGCRVDAGWRPVLERVEFEDSRLAGSAGRRKSRSPCRCAAPSRKLVIRDRLTSRRTGRCRRQDFANDRALFQPVRESRHERGVKVDGGSPDISSPAGELPLAQCGVGYVRSEAMVPQRQPRSRTSNGRDSNFMRHPDHINPQPHRRPKPASTGDPDATDEEPWRP